MGKKKNHKKYTGWIESDEPCAVACPEPLSAEYHPPPEMWLGGMPPDGIIFGTDPSSAGYDNFVGVKIGEEGHTTVIGGSGAGKSANIAKHTLLCWRGKFVATDVKGDISEHYMSAYEQGVVDTPAIIFDLSDPNSLGYDPYQFLRDEGDDNLISNALEIAYCLIPDKPGDTNPFWRDKARSILAAGIVYCYKLNMDFSDTILLLAYKSLLELNDEVRKSRNESAKLLLGNLSGLKSDVIAGLEAQLHSILIDFMEPYIAHAFRGNRDSSDCFTWDDLEHYNIILRVPENRITQWGSAINLLYTQLFRYLMRRPDKYSPERRNTLPILLLMDEFAQFGRIPHMTNAISTLRSRNVNICILIQSLAQLDATYGVEERKIILDNCSFKVILRVNDPDTQKYICDMIGTHLVLRKSCGENYIIPIDTESYSTQESETREYRIFPHELAF